MEGARARQLLIATGLRDELPAVPGVAERFARSIREMVRGLPVASGRIHMARS